jgi:hypothetical protein
MRVVMLLLLVLMFPAQVLAGSITSVPVHDNNRITTEHVQLVSDVFVSPTAMDLQQHLPDDVSEPPQFVLQADIEEVALPDVLTASHSVRAGYARPKFAPFAFYALPDDVFRPPRTVQD